jgi:hypothetical protein
MLRRRTTASPAVGAGAACGGAPPLAQGGEPPAAVDRSGVGPQAAVLPTIAEAARLARVLARRVGTGGAETSGQVL